MPKPNRPSPHADPGHLEPRVARLEGEIDRVVSAVDTLAATVEKSRQIFSNELSSLSDKITTRTAPNFSTMAAWAGVILGVVGMVGTLVNNTVNKDIATLTVAQLKTQNDFQESQRAQAKSSEDSAYRRGGVDERLNSFRTSLDELTKSTILAQKGLDEKLQREMNLINAEIKTDSLLTKSDFLDRLATLIKQFDDIKLNGSPITRERLAVLESQVRAIQKEKP